MQIIQFGERRKQNNNKLIHKVKKGKNLQKKDGSSRVEYAIIFFNSNASLNCFVRKVLSPFRVSLESKQ